MSSGAFFPLTRASSVQCFQKALYDDMLTTVEVHPPLGIFSLPFSKNRFHFLQGRVRELEDLLDLERDARTRVSCWVVGERTVQYREATKKPNRFVAKWRIAIVLLTS